MALSQPEDQSGKARQNLEEVGAVTHAEDQPTPREMDYSGGLYVTQVSRSSSSAPIEQDLSLAWPGRSSSVLQAAVLRTNR